MNRINKTTAAMVTVMATIFGGASAAFAQETPADPTAGAAGQIQSQATSWVTSQGVPLIVGLLVIGIVVSLLVKFARRGARSA